MTLETKALVNLGFKERLQILFGREVRIFTNVSIDLDRPSLAVVRSELHLQRFPGERMAIAIYRTIFNK